MEYQLDRDYLEAKNKKTYNAIIIGGLVLIVGGFFVTNTLWIVPLIILLIIAVSLRSKHKKEESEAEQHKITVENGTLTIHWPGAYSTVKNGELKKLASVQKDNVLKTIKLYREDGQINHLEGYKNMAEMLEDIKNSLTPGEFVEE